MTNTPIPPADLLPGYRQHRWEHRFNHLGEAFLHVVAQGIHHRVDLVLVARDAEVNELGRSGASVYRVGRKLGDEQETIQPRGLDRRTTQAG